MNTLSNFLLAKKKGINDTDTLSIKNNKRKYFKSKIFPINYVRGTKLPIKSKFKFENVVLAMKATRGLYSKDRLQFRKNRLGERGGVVNFAWEKFEKKSKFRIQKCKAKRSRPNHINYKDREKYAKIIQEWWKERKLKYKRKLERIIKIQSVYRGKFTRKYVYQVLSLGYLCKKFIDIMNKTLVNHIRPKVFDELFPRNKLLK